MTVAELITDEIERAIVRHGERPPGVPDGVSYMSVLIPDASRLLEDIRAIVTRALSEGQP